MAKFTGNLKSCSNPIKILSTVQDVFIPQCYTGIKLSASRSWLTEAEAPHQVDATSGEEHFLSRTLN